MIGVVTSPTGAVIRDILHRLDDRFPRRVLVWPVRVQGETSAAEVAAAIQGFNALPEAGPLPRPDLIIVARGGGSLEDLWSFNEEIVVRAAAASMIPLISAVGHETDMTLIDFAADRRAPTPTAAAEMAVPVRAELLTALAKSRLAQARLLAARCRSSAARSCACSRARCRRSTICSRVPRQRLDACAGRLPRALRANAQIHHTQSDARRLAAVAAVLSHRIDRCREQTAVIRRAVRAVRLPDFPSTAALQRLRSAGQLLAAYSYRGVLARGFALVRDGDGHPLRTAAAVGSGMRLDIEFSDGRVGATADGERAAAPPAKSKPRTRGGEGSGGQGSLFGA